MRNLFKLKNQESQRGAAAVEFALVLPILVLLFAGIVEFSLLLYNQQVITNAGREGARIAINPIPEPTQSMIENIVEEYCEERMISFNNNLNALNIFINNLNGVAGTDVSIRVTYEYGFLIPGLFNLGPTYTLQSTTIMRTL